MIYLSDISEFDESFYKKAALMLPNEKQDSVLRIAHERAKKESILAWLLLRYALSDNGITKMPAIDFSEKGKPFFGDNEVYFNLSHSGSKVCVALSFKDEVGVDVQKKADFSANMKKRVFAQNELVLAEDCDDESRYFTKLWAIKESFLKNTGSGIAYDLKSLDYSEFCMNDRFKKDGLCYTVFEIENHFISVCTAETGGQRLEVVPKGKLVNFVKLNGCGCEGEY